MISIVLPNLNTPIDFLKKRLETIKNQTSVNWECIVIDGFSTNGSWEYLKSQTEKEVRFRLYQLPKKGIYNAWNEGIYRANGEFIYIATSDDTMSNELIEKMQNALIKNPDCSIAHCGLTIIDGNDNPVDHSWEKYWTSQYFGTLLQQSHKRLAPHDGILHMSVQTVYTSITQLLIKESVFREVGVFLTDVGPIADFEWGMRVALLENIIYVPEKLATWRLHSDQATDSNYNNTAAHRKKIVQLANHAFNFSNQTINIKNKHDLNALFFVFDTDRFRFLLREEKSLIKKITIAFYWSFKHFNIVYNYLLVKLNLKSNNFDRVQFIRNYIISKNLNKNIIILS
ncbi:glycosyltransferase [Mucilaginibacter sp.]|uniref:glycosyltransferase n=1 Tax=Mucilaginibacter sp. TaxID=1882438 RepID=UPI003AFF9336